MNWLTDIVRPKIKKITEVNKGNRSIPTIQGILNSGSSCLLTILKKMRTLMTKTTNLMPIQTSVMMPLTWSLILGSVDIASMTPSRKNSMKTMAAISISRISKTRKYPENRFLKNFFIMSPPFDDMYMLAHFCAIFL